MNKKALNIILGILPLIIFLTLWEFLVSGSGRAKFLFASPSLVFQSFIKNIGNGLLVNDFWVTAKEVTLGFIFGNVVGGFIGLSLWYSKRTAILSRPYIIVIGVIPIFAIAPMMIIWFGTGTYAKVMMAAISTITIAITQSYEGAKSVDVQQINLLKAFGASNNQIFKILVVPSSLVWLFNSLKLNIGFAILGAFIGEYISAEEGLGFRIFKAGGTYDVPLVIASILCIIILAFLLNISLYLIERNYLKWKK